MNAAQPLPPQWTLGDRLRKARAEAGLDQDAMARELDVSRATVSKWESGVREPKLRLIRRWAEITETPVEWLLGIYAASGTASTYKPSNDLSLPFLTLVPSDDG